MNQNEWGQLRKVVVGVANNARIPETDLSMRVVNYADQKTVDAKVGSYPTQVITEMNQDLQILDKFLSDEGVEVVRPAWEPYPVSQYYQVCPRDSVFIHGDVALATPMPIRARKNDYFGMRNLIPSLTVISPEFDDSLYNEECIGNKDILALNETAPAFDAANIIRANEHVLYLVSNMAYAATNSAGLFTLTAKSVLLYILGRFIIYYHIFLLACLLFSGSIILL